MDSFTLLWLAASTITRPSYCLWVMVTQDMSPRQSLTTLLKQGRVLMLAGYLELWFLVSQDLPVSLMLG